MQIHEEYVKVLAKLGLTHNQAKVYVALLSLKNATARSAQKLSNVARQDVYQVLSELGEKGLIEKILAKPEKFRPIPVNEAISILVLERNERRVVNCKTRQSEHSGISNLTP
jgi:sugar-specific transcriptional regulator TrmB